MRFAWSTKWRRYCANLVLILILLLGMAISLVAVTVKNSAHYFASQLINATSTLGLANASNASAAASWVLSPSSASAISGVALANATDPTMCTAESEALVARELSNPIEYIMRTSQAAEPGVEALALLVALLSCYLIPVMRYLVTFVIVSK